MKKISPKSTLSPMRKSPAAERVEREIAAIKRVAKRVSASPETAQAFLQSAGIVDSKGNLAKKYR